MRLVSCQSRHVSRPETSASLHLRARLPHFRFTGGAEKLLPLHGGSSKTHTRQASLKGTPASQRLRPKCSTSPQTPQAREGVTPRATSADHSLLLKSPLGIDFGQARIGLATCPGGFVSTPLKILDSRRRLWLELAEEIIEIAQQQGVDGFVVGLPVTSHGNIRRHGTDSMQGQACRNFAQILHATARPHGLPVLLFDERMTSSDAAAALGLQGSSRLKQKLFRLLYGAQGKLDAVAAAMLLTAYFERPEGAIRVKSIKHR